MLNKKSVENKLSNDEELNLNRMNTISDIYTKLKYIVEEINSYLYEKKHIKLDMKKTDLFSKPIKELYSKFKEHESKEKIELSKDNNGKFKKLNETQLLQIEKNGEFSINSKEFKQHCYVWKLSRLLQEGSDMRNETLINDIVHGTKQFIVNIPNKLIGNTNSSGENNQFQLSFLNGLLNIRDFIYDVINMGIGIKKMKHKYNEYDIDNMLIKYRIDECDNYFKNNKKWIEKNKIYKALLKSKELENLSNIVDEFIVKWNKNNIYRRSEIYNKIKVEYENVIKINLENGNKYNDDDDDDLKNKVIEHEANLLQNEIYNSARKNLDKEKANIVISIIKVKNRIRKLISNRNSDKKHYLDMYEKNIRKHHPILSSIKYWLENKVENESIKWDKEYNMDNKIINALKNIEDGELEYEHVKKCLEIEKSEEYNKIKHKYFNEMEYSDTFEWKFRIYKSSNWIIKSNIKDKDDVKVVKYKKYKTNTNHCWRITNLISHFAQTINNSVYYLGKNMIYGDYGLRSLYGISCFASNYKYDKTLKTILPNEKKHTWLGKIDKIWKDVKESRINFFKEEGDGFLSSEISNGLNIIWNYLFKGVLKTSVTFIIHPILTLFNVLSSLMIIITSPIWVSMYCISSKLFDTIIYDQYLDKLFPLLRTILKLLWGIIQVLSPIITIPFYAIFGLLIYIFGLIKYILKLTYDKMMMSMIRRKAHVPNRDNFLVKCISGPGEGIEYIFKVDKSILNLVLEYCIEKEKVNHYKKHIETKIDDAIGKIDKLNLELKKYGLSIDSDSDMISKIKLDREKSSIVLNESIIKHFKIAKENMSYIKENKGKFRMHNKDIEPSLIYGSKMIEKNLKNSVIDWENKSLIKYDWKGLAKYYYEKYFGNEIMKPIESLTIKHIIKDVSLKTIYDKIKLNDEGVDKESNNEFIKIGYIEMIENNELNKENIKNITIDDYINLKEASNKYEKYIQ